MRSGALLWDHGPMATVPPPGSPPARSPARPGHPARPWRGHVPEGLARAERPLVAGVAGGVGTWLGVDPVLVRLAVVLLTLAGGWGAVVYLLAWAALPPAGGGAPAPRRGVVPGAAEPALAFGLVAFGALLLVQRSGWWFPAGLVWPAALASAGLALVWSRSEEADRERWRELAARVPGDPRSLLVGGRALAARAVAGTVLVLVGVLAFVASSDVLGSLGQVGLAVLATAVGVGLLVGPWVLRLGRALTDERAERVRADERAEVAGHLHDSGLQTLALIQRRAGSPTDTVALARRQERELRTWLFAEGDRVAGDRTVAAALDDLATDVEARHGTTVEVVTVGDAAVDEALGALVAATGEPTVNAARHSGAAEVAIYVEVEPEGVTAFVRDRGRGFDPAAVDGDRRGIAESIVGRMDRHGGTAEITSEPGTGTEVALSVWRTVTLRSRQAEQHDG